jgi:Cof subfamily protein (haloacid dehalogenase superfamily)
MWPRLVALDLDGTLLNRDGRLTARSVSAVQGMAASGAVVALASGRLASSMRPHARRLGVDVALLTLNGADVYLDRARGGRLVYEAHLPAAHADALLARGTGRGFALNYYLDGRLHAVRTPATARWLALYWTRTRTPYALLPSLEPLRGRSPSKVVFVGEPAELDREERHAREAWGDLVDVCRTCDHYLEFMDPAANKGLGLRALAGAYGVEAARVLAIGDGANDVPMLRAAGLGIALRHAPDAVKAAARRVSPWDNEEDGVAREWEQLAAAPAAP